MPGGVELGALRERDRALRIDDVGDAADVGDQQALGLVLDRDLPLLVGDERVLEAERRGEVALLVVGVAADADDLDVVGSQLRQRLLEPAPLDGSTGGEGLREEEQHDPPAAQVGERDRVALRRAGGELGRRLSDLQHAASVQRQTSIASSAWTGA